MILSIVIPTRNRQEYIVSAIKAITENASSDIEVIIADNSDDGELLPLRLGCYVHDKRIRILPPEKQVLSMKENWERALHVTNGQWVSYIGDDDLIDPALVGFLNVLNSNSPQTEVLTWDIANYVWPDARSSFESVGILPIGDGCVNLSKEKMLERLFLWENKRNPGSGASIYHGAFKRSLINRIKESRGGRFFKYEIVDFDMGHSAYLYATNVAISRRVFSIHGASKKSNSGGLNNYTGFKEKVRQWQAETKKIDGADLSPLEPTLSISTSIYAFQLQFCSDYNLPYKTNPENIIRALEIDTSVESDQTSFDEKRNCISEALRLSPWSNLVGKYNPIYKSQRLGNPIRGVYKGDLYVPFDINGSKDIYEFYKNTFWLLLKPELVGRDLNVKIL